MTDRVPLRLRIAAIRYEADSVRSFELVAEDGRVLPPVEAGAHIDLALPGGFTRSYSIINTTGPADRYLIAVNREADSRGGSAHLCDVARVGDLIDVTPPLNTFRLAEDAEETLLLAGGIGITPILGMVRRLKALGHCWRLVYAARSRAAAAFLPEILVLAAANPGGVTLHFDDEAGRYLDAAAAIGAASPQAHLYCCGPEPMLAAFKSATAGRDPDRIHVEHFAGTAARPSGEFTVMLKRSGRTIVVPAGRTIMEVLQEAGIRVAYSCRSGVCGTCETRVLDGVPDHKDNVLSPREQASGKVIMICCSGAKSDLLVLDL
ncbi:2Fe-2S iron-sulfur cluster-binding protein [Pleomorphomonas sp. PLEO]|uniref:PDR/VanB family oxidoreductase n=1 Tax=Pleomorphomonas sp. PLEO TaxID=3239306 RepID=UPI00351F1A5E